jgi:NADH-quinone oxidoreductase subunit N
VTLQNESAPVDSNFIMRAETPAWVESGTAVSSVGSYSGSTGLTGMDLRAVLPVLLLAVTAVCVMLWIAFRRSHRAVLILTLLGLTFSLASLPYALSVAPRAVAGLFLFDPWAYLYGHLILLAAMVVVLFSYHYLERASRRPEEFYLLLLLATVGAVLLAACNHFVSFFLSLEVLSVALYGMLAYTRQRECSIEAGLKYLILAATSTAFLLLGIALVYFRLGSLSFSAWEGSGIENLSGDLFLMAGLGLILTGFAFKLGIAPFHIWTADVYEGAPALATSFIATVSKGAVFGAFLRFFASFPDGPPPVLFNLLSLLAVASMFVGNLLALRQTRVKRLLAYSSIAHFGYLLVAFLAGGVLAQTLTTFYLIVYVLTTLGAFGTVAVLSSNDRDADLIEDYRGLAWRRPGLAVVFMTLLFSLAGIPLTAGFTGKFCIVTAGIQSSLWALLFILIANSAIGLYYYLRVVVAMLSPGETSIVENEPFPTDSELPCRSGFILAVSTLMVLLALIVWFGCYPAPLLAMLQSAAGSFL